VYTKYIILEIQMRTVVVAVNYVCLLLADFSITSHKYVYRKTQ